MKPEKLCAVCERDINSLSPDMETQLRVMRSEGLIGEEATVAPELTVELKDGSTSHERCKEIFDFLNRVSPEFVERRLKGYRAGKPFEAYMNWPNGLEAPSADSYRVLKTACVAMDNNIQMHWRLGNVLPGECFELDSSREILLVQDINFDESDLTRWFADMAQAILSYAVILWCDAHKSDAPRPDDQEMFLEENMYDDAMKQEANYFRITKRNKAIGHISTNNWDTLNTNRSYEPYRQWATDWERFRKLLGHSIDLCIKDICGRLGEEVPNLIGYPRNTGWSGDPIQPGVDLVNALGMPIPKGTGPRPPLQGPYPFKFDGTKWVRC